jgi:hypothetical protein
VVNALTLELLLPPERFLVRDGFPGGEHEAGSPPIRFNLPLCSARGTGSRRKQR